uniref:Uncharacterized protein n=1 Tax=Rhizophora mucronata TaxID=61149 RepID=A0A2P2JGW5_RHIMU
MHNCKTAFSGHDKLWVLNVPVKGNEFITFLCKIMSFCNYLALKIPCCPFPILQL